MGIVIVKFQFPFSEAAVREGGTDAGAAEAGGVGNAGGISSVRNGAAGKLWRSTTMPG